MTTQRRTATVFVNRTFTNVTPARNTTLIHVHARTVQRMRTAAVLTKAGTPTATADAESFARTGNTGTVLSVFQRSVHAKHLTTVSAAITVLTIPADRDAKAMMIVKAVIAKTTNVFRDAEMMMIVTAILPVMTEFVKNRVKLILQIPVPTRDIPHVALTTKPNFIVVVHLHPVEII